MSRQKICTVAGPSNALLRSIRRKRHLMAATVLGAFVLGESASALCWVSLPLRRLSPAHPQPAGLTVLWLP
ncbi:hypothetical protein [Acetobacter malorum]|uniref:hypothetical protein n=1 Tax=Acetobacter malorum TaxID=178901 RepID=UPI000AF356F6|nr:hypothetical protein [Acetobacter malorum]